MLLLLFYMLGAVVSQNYVNALLPPHGHHTRHAVKRRNEYSQVQAFLDTATYTKKPLLPQYS